MSQLGMLPPEIVTPPSARGYSAWIERLSKTESPAFTARRKRREETTGAPMDPIVWSAAKGANVVDSAGNRYVDLTSGFGVQALGHGHPAVIEAIQSQSERLIHALGDVHPSEVKIELLEALCARSPFGTGNTRVALGLSGSDAIEVALKTAALKTARPGVLAFKGGYHGLSAGPLSACGYKSAFRAPFSEQLNPHVHFAAYGCDPGVLDASIGAIVVEPMLGRGGVVLPPADFLSTLRRRADEASAVLIVDEIFTGLGRCGQVFLSGDIADLICVGKALGGGMPISACLGRADVMRAWGDPAGEAIHTGTFFGHPLSCAAALASLQAMDELKVAERAQKLGAEMRQKLEAQGFVVRGIGLALGVETEHALGLVSALLDRGYLTLAAGPKADVLQITPPLTIDEALLTGFVEVLRRCVDDFR